MRSPLIRILILVAMCPLFAMGVALRQVAIVDLPGRPGFDDMAIVRGMVVMTHSGAGSVDVFDQTKRRVVAHVDGIEGARGLAVDEAAGKVYVSGRDSISIIDVNGWKVAGSIPVQGRPDSLLFLSQPRRLVFTDSRAQTINAVDPGTRQVLTSVPVGGRTGYIAFDNARNLIYATIQDLKQVVALDPALKIVKRINVTGSQPTGIAFDASADRLYVSVRYAIVALNPDTGAELSRVAAPAGVDRLWLDEGAHTLVAAAGGSVMMVSTAGATLSASEEIPTDVKGYAVAYDPQRKLVYLPGGREGRSKLLILKQTGAALQQGTQNAEAALH